MANRTKWGHPQSHQCSTAGGERGGLLSVLRKMLALKVQSPFACLLWFRLTGHPGTQTRFISYEKVAAAQAGMG